MDELKPCPFCGGRATEYAALITSDGKRLVEQYQCEDCHCFGPSRKIYWNCRAPQDDTALREACEIIERLMLVCPQYVRRAARGAAARAFLEKHREAGK